MSAARPAHRVTTRHAQAIYPFTAAGGLGGRGAFIGRDTSGGAFCFDPWVLYEQGVLDDPNAIVIGKLGQGKSALVKTLLWRMLLFGRRAFVLDVKREYGPLCEAVGVRPISLVPGGGVRLNPLAARPEEHAQIELLRAIATTAIGAPVNQVEAGALREALRTVRRHGDVEPTLPQIAAVLFTPPAEMAAQLQTSLERLAIDSRRAALALQDLCEGPLKGIFDGPTTPGLDLDAKLLVLDLHAVRDSPAVGNLMACATAWMGAQLAKTAEQPGRGRMINVADESWKIIQHQGLGEWFQSNFKLARQFGVMNLVVLHKLGDLQAAGDAGSRAARIAEGLIADASTRVVYHQDESQVQSTRDLLGLSATEARLLTQLSSGQALWRVGARVRGPALPLEDGAAAHQHRHRDGAGGRSSPLATMIDLHGEILPFGAAAAAVVLAWVARDGSAGTASAMGRSDGGAHWASARDLRVLRVRRRGASRPAGRLTLGRHRGRLLYAERRHALVAFGPPQSGKSAGLAIPALLEWSGPAVASSIKTDLLGATLKRRAELSEALIFDPFALSGLPSHTWSPLHGAGTWDGALETAWRLAAAGELDQRGVEGGDFWSIAAEQRLAPLLYAAARAGDGIEQVVAWTYGQDGRALDSALDMLIARATDARQHADARAAYEAVRAFEAQADRTRTSIEATAQALMRAYRFTRVARSANGCEITADRLLSASSTLYLIGDAKASKLLRPLFVALLSEVVDRAYAIANRHGGRLPRPLLLCLDEAGNVAPLPNLSEIASTAPSHNIQLISIFHDLAQARSRYQGQAETVINSHRARMLLPGVADIETLRYFSGLVGEQERQELTRTVGRGGTTRATARRRLPLISAEALRQLPEGDALLLYGRLAPVRLQLRTWFADRRLRKLARGHR